MIIKPEQSNDEYDMEQKRDGEREREAQKIQAERKRLWEGEFKNV